MPMGTNNLITDVDGLRCGHAQDDTLRSGVSLLLLDEMATAACEISGGAPGTVGQDVLDAQNIVEGVHGLFLSGGSVYGLASHAGMVDWLGAQGVGFRFSEQETIPPAPIVAGAILYDLNNGGEKSWRNSPYYNLAQAACENASSAPFPLGNVGAGLGAVAGSVKGGLGSASFITPDGFQCAALVAVNSFGSVINPNTGKLWAAALAQENEMGSGVPDTAAPNKINELFAESKLHPRAGTNTVIALCATNAVLSKGEAKRLAVMAQDGITRACRPSHTLFDGDSVFVVGTGKKPLDAGLRELTITALGATLADCLTRAIGRGVWEAESAHQSISYRQAFGL